MKSILLFILGTLAYFLWRFINRTNKTEFSFKFWLKDNWAELSMAFIFDISAVLILLDPQTGIDFSKIDWMPVWLTLPAKLVLSFFCGYGGGFLVYEAFASKLKGKEPNK